jgi:hypothetical protein
MLGVTTALLNANPRCVFALANQSGIFYAGQLDQAGNYYMSKFTYGVCVPLFLYLVPLSHNYCYIQALRQDFIGMVIMSLVSLNKMQEAENKTKMTICAPIEKQRKLFCDFCFLFWMKKRRGQEGQEVGFGAKFLRNIL